MMLNFRHYCLLVLVFAFLAGSGFARAESVNRLLVEVKTADKLFAGTDNSIYLSFGGEQFKLDDPDRDDFERGNTDTFTIDLSGREMDFSLLRQLRELTILKPKNDFWGGGWDLAGLTIRVAFAEPHLTPPDEPIFRDSGIGVELDSDRTSWAAFSDDDGWRFPPEPPAWGPCVSEDIDTGGELDSDCDGIPDADDDSFDRVRPRHDVCLRSRL